MLDGKAYSSQTAIEVMLASLKNAITERDASKIRLPTIIPLKTFSEE